MIIPSVGLLLIPASLVFLIVGKRKLIKVMGILEQTLTLKWNFLDISIVVCTPILIMLNYFRDLGGLTVFAITGVGVLGFFIGAKNLLYKKICGIYANGIIWLADSILYDKIDEFKRIEPITIEIVTHDRNRITIISANSRQSDLIFAKLESVKHPLQ